MPRLTNAFFYAAPKGEQHEPSNGSVNLNSLRLIPTKGDSRVADGVALL
jgi:hypothetical protein